MKVDGKSLNRLHRQPDSDTLTQQKNGSWKGTVLFYCAWNKVFTLMPRRNATKHPDFNSMICSNVKVVKLKPSVAKITATYTGNPETSQTGGGGGPNTDKVKELVNSVSQDPIETHPDFATFGVALNGAKFDGEGLFLGFGEPQEGGTDLRGLTDYLVPKVTYSESKILRNEPTSIGGIGTRDTPADAPSVGSGYTWLKTSITWRRDGGAYEQREEWLLSGPKGWNTTIYS